MITDYIVDRLMEAGLGKERILPVAAQAGSLSFPFCIYTPGPIRPVRDLSGEVAYVSCEVRLDVYHDDYDELCEIDRKIWAAFQELNRDFKDVYIYSSMLTSQAADGFVPTDTCWGKSYSVNINYWEEGM